MAKARDTGDREAFVEKYGTDFPTYARDNLTIANKKGKFVPLELNSTQRQVWAAYEKARTLGLPPRLIILKSRQVGISTLAEAILFWRCHLNDNLSGFVVANKDSLTKLLFRMCHRFADNLPAEHRMPRKFSNVKEIRFEQTGSGLSVETEGEVVGITANGGAHISEMALMEHPKELLSSLLQGVPDDPAVPVFIESTAYGAGGYFHDLWVKAVTRSNDPRLPEEERGWTPIFIPWFQHEEYIRRPWFMPEDVTQKERDLARQYGLNMRQIAWRRWCIENNCDGDEETFSTWYPANWNEAFLLSGRTVFDKEGLAYFNSLVPPSVPQETLPPECEVTVDEKGKPQIDVVRNGRLRIYNEPQPRHRYIVAADPSEGDRGSDPSPLVVIDEMTLDVDAVWWGRSPPDELARTAVWLATYYNKGLVANEANNHGIMFHNTVLDMGYPNLYFRLTSEESVAGAIIEKPGLWMSEKVRHAVIDTFRQYVRLNPKTGQPKGKIRDPRLVAELGTLIYVERPGGGSKIEAQAGCHKDLVMAAGIALYVHRGPIEAPLEPLPEDVIRSAAIEARMRRERDPEGAKQIALDISQLTCDELFALEDAILLRDKRRQRLGLSGMT